MLFLQLQYVYLAKGTKDIPSREARHGHPKNPNLARFFLKVCQYFINFIIIFFVVQKISRSWMRPQPCISEPSLQHAFSLTEPILCFSKRIVPSSVELRPLTFLPLLCFTSPHFHSKQMWKNGYVCIFMHAEHQPALTTLFTCQSSFRQYSASKMCYTYPHTHTHTKQQHPLTHRGSVSA